MSTSSDSSSNAEDLNDDPVEVSTSFPTPASYTKHLTTLLHPIPKRSDVILYLHQISSTPAAAASTSENRGTGTTGTTLWLSAQILSAYLASALPDPSSSSAGSKSRRALELGSGIGYTALTLAARGWQVTATDIEPVLSSVLRPNVERGTEVLRASSGREGVVMNGRRSRGDGRTDKTEGGVCEETRGEVRVKELDWADVARLRKCETCQHARNGSSGPAPRASRDETGSTPKISAPAGGVRANSIDQASNNTAAATATATGDNPGMQIQEQRSTLSSDSTDEPQGQPAGPAGHAGLSWLDEQEGWDMIFMTDTFYAPHLIEPLWDTLAYVSSIRTRRGRGRIEEGEVSASTPGEESETGSKEVNAAPTDTDGQLDGEGEGESTLDHPDRPKSHPTSIPSKTPMTPISNSSRSSYRPTKEITPTIYIALECRDPTLIAQALQRGRAKNFELRKIGRGRIEKALKDVGWSWEADDWEGVEVWKGRWRG